MDGFVSVSERVYVEFMGSYPKKLDIDVNHACDPPMVTYNDLGNYLLSSCVIGYYRDDEGWNISRQVMIDRLGFAMQKGGPSGQENR
tara:strand:+ start:635 stop:895 length:261 start_codon:yes stop_codon:yes gene_type:complete